MKLADSVGHVRVATNFAWTLNTGYLVLFMQAGFALLTCGLVRKKNAAHLMMLNFAAYVFAFIAYYAVGYAFQFGAVAVNAAPSNLGGTPTLNHFLVGNGLWGFLGGKGFFLSGPAYDAGSNVLTLFEVVFMETAGYIIVGAICERITFWSFILCELFIGAATTKIYCRPICPIPFARPNSLVWFASAAAAEAAGYRPCGRCRPEASPGTPAWLGTSAIVSRALRLISEGALDENSVEDLAGRVGIGARQLRRLFVEHLGATPVKIAITHRVHFARNLIEETDLPITKIALSAGFTSIRQFNHEVRAICGQSPTELRRARGEFSASSQSGLVIRLACRPPFDWPAIVEFLKPRAIPGVEVVAEGSYQRTIRVGGSTGIIEVRPAKTEPALAVRIELPGCQFLMKVVDRVRRIFDLGADPLRIVEDLSRDPRLKPLLDRRPGLRVPGVWDGFELAVLTVLGEQLTVNASSALAGRFVQTFGRPLQTSTPGLTHLFPRPQDIVAADLSRAGIRGARAATLHALARAVCGGKLTFAASMTLEEAIRRICGIPGIGESTAHYIAIRALGEPDAFPSADPNLRSRLGVGAHPASLPQVLRIAEGWRPWRAYAAMHIGAAPPG